MIKFYNTLTKKKETFIPINKKEVKIYSCGPTVYDYAHIGNFRAYIFEDLLIRFLEYKGFKVTQVMNITDVDDKTIKGANELGISLEDYTKKYEDAFFEDIKSLKIRKADFYPRATEHIPEMIELIKKLDEKGYTYKLNGSVYYSIKKFSDYGKLSRIDLNGVIDGARVDSDEYEKEDLKDFVLWKKAKENEPCWETEYGKGRPGWHIECSSMSMKYLGNTFDLHTGGVDLIFPHHENEIAQSVGATGKPFVRCWLHCEHLIVNGEKMSKSKGNFYTLRTLLEKGYSPSAIRFSLLSTHYRKKVNFTEDGLKSASSAVQRINESYNNIKNYKCTEKNDKQVPRFIKKRLNEFEKNLEDDLNISPAIGSFFEFIREVNTRIEKENITEKEKKSIIEAFDKFNNIVHVLKKEETEIDRNIQRLISDREEARKNKDYVTGDKIRDKLRELGILIEDTKNGIRWKKIK